MSVVFVAVGSNIDPEHNIPTALERLKAHVCVTGVSTFYRTAPLRSPHGAAPETQPAFINGVFRLETSIPARELKIDVLRKIEETLGRVRTTDKYAPRPIDLDIAMYGDQVIDLPGLHVPDSDIRTRNFIAVPLLELAPDLRLPDGGERLSDLSAAHDSKDMEALGHLTAELRRIAGE
jgi:2-amino-4-hydroxy-6-hydroxymethyldihydropteridine diphosphokinase